MFDQLNTFFSVGNTISPSANTQPDDVLKTKSALAQTGDYKVPDFGITDIPDMGMIDGLKSFQQKNGLKVDGVMKPNGPTEAKLGETMAHQGINTNDLLEAAKPKPKPKASKIDPLTGLPEVKMPKLKKPTAKMWEQVAQQQKPKVNPWFQSSKIKPVKDEAHSANTRTMDGLLQYSKNGSLPALYADSLKNGDEKAVYEYANFMQQLSNRKGERVDEFHQEVVGRLPNNMKQVFAQLEMENDGNETSVATNTGTKAFSADGVQRGKNGHEQDPENFVQRNAQESQGKKAQGEMVRGTMNENDSVEANSEGRKPDESIEEFCAALPGLIQKARDDLEDYEDAYEKADERLENLPGEIENEEDNFRLALTELAVALGTDAMTIAWGSIPAVLVAGAQRGLDVYKLQAQYTRINEMKNDLHKYETDKKWADGMIKSEKAHIERMLKTQREKCN